MKKYENNIPKILYKYRDLTSGFAEKILSNGEIYFATTNELKDINEKASFILTKGAWISDKNNSLTLLSREQNTAYLMNAVKSDKNQPYGILSLCESKGEIRMYDEYADGFKGICIGFDWEKFELPFAGSYPLVKNVPRRVIYQEDIKIDSTHITPEQWMEIFCSKLPKFSYEKELRMFYNRGIFANDSVRRAIKEIIFGYKVSASKILQIKRLVSDLPGVNFFIAQEINSQILIENLSLEKMSELEQMEE